MKLKTSEFTFKFERKTYTASVQEIKVAALPQIRVSVSMPNEKFEKAFIFYRDKRNTLYRYPYHDAKQDAMADAIAKQLSGFAAVNATTVRIFD